MKYALYFGSLAVLVFLVLQRSVHCGNNRPYGVDIRGSEGAARTGQDAGANGYAGSSLVAPLASEGFNSPRERYQPSNAYPGNPSGIGFGGFGWRSPAPSSGGY